MFRLEGVRKVYTQRGREVTALDNTTLEIAQGDYVALVGPSGSGKTTLLSMLGGMLAPTQGEVWLDGKSVYRLSLADRARLRRDQLGFVFQTFNLVPYLTALENVQMPLLLAGKASQQQRTRAEQLLARLGLADRALHKPAELSTGQQQRVALARTLANDPAVILADEPTGNLDPEMREEALAILDEFHGEGRTIIVVTHDPLVAQRAGRLLRLSEGRIEAAAPEPIRKSA